MQRSEGVTTIITTLLAPLAALVVAAPGINSHVAAVTPVSDAGQFSAALAKARPGDTIALADGSYPTLTVNRQFASTVAIQGSRNVKIAGMTFKNASNVKLSGVTITPPGNARVKVALSSSSNITIDHILLDGRVESAGAVIDPDPDNSNITIQDSEIVNCGTGARCIAPGATNLRILRNNFHDCLDCDFIRGGGGNGTVVQGNTFDRAVAGSCQGGATVCHHNDHIQIMGGGPWTIVGNRFGDRGGGAASVFVSEGPNNTSNRVHDVLVESNIFKGKSTGHYGIVLGGSVGGGVGLPLRISVVNNTILSGFAAAINIREEWAKLPADQRPLVANNILGISKDSLCKGARTSHNLVLQGDACSTDTLGPANLDDAGAPTKDSRLLINHGEAADAPATDFFGRPRVGLPDIGAVEWISGLVVTAPKSLVLHLARLRAYKWAVTVRVGAVGAANVQARLVRRGKTLLTLVRPVAASGTLTLRFTLPRAARRPGQLGLVLRATSADGKTGSRTVAILIRR